MGIVAPERLAPLEVAGRGPSGRGAALVTTPLADKVVRLADGRLLVPFVAWDDNLMAVTR